jgi:hypothetical protein
MTGSSKDITVPFGSKILREMLKCVAHNFLTSYDLLAALRTLGFRETGAVTEVRLKKCPLEKMEESDIC